MQMERVPYMSIVNCEISISTSDAELRPLPAGFVEAAPSLDIESVKYIMEADAHTTKHWLDRLGWLVARSGPGIEKGTSRDISCATIDRNVLFRGYPCVYTCRFP